MRKQQKKSVEQNTERKQAEEALRRAHDEMEQRIIERTASLQASEEYSRSILNTSVDGIIVIDEQGKVSTLNPAAERLFGYSSDEVAGQNVRVLMPEPYRSEHDGYLKRYVETGEAKIIGIGREVEGKRKDGTTFPIELAVSEMRVGDARMFTGIARDISERKAAALDESEARFKDVAEAATDWIWETDEKLRFSYFSGRMFEVTGVEPEDLLGKTRRELARDRGDEATWAAHLAELEARRPFRDFQYEFKRPDGGILHWSISGKPVFDDDGSFTGYRGTGTDVTAQVRAEAALKESEQQLRLIADGLPILLVYIDAERRFRFVNKTCETWFARPQADILGKRVSEILGEDSINKMRPHAEKVLAGEPQTFDDCITYPDGKIRDVNLAYVPHLDTEGKVLGYYSMVMDVTERKRAEGELRATSERLQMLIESSPLAIYTRDLNGLVTSWNPAAEQMFGWKPSEVLDKPLPSVPGEDRAASDALRARLLTGETVRYEARRRRRDDSPIDIDAFVGPLRDQSQHIDGIIAVVADISERKRAEKRLLESETQLRLITDNVPATIAYFDTDLYFEFANAEYVRFFAGGTGGTRGTGGISGMHLREVIGDATYKEIEGHLNDVLEGRRVTYERLGRGEGGESRNIEITLVPDITEEGEVRGFFSLGNDVTEHKRTQARIQHLAHHDALTGLANRTLLYDHLKHAIAVARRERHELAVLYLDLDKFKAANDAFGHAAGDEILKGAAQRISQSVRESDMVGRMGGDEFVVILSKITSPDGAATVARKIITALTAPFQLRSVKQEVCVGASVGVALYAGETQDADALLKAADSAMYGAKRVGNSFEFFDA